MADDEGLRAFISSRRPTPTCTRLRALISSRRPTPSPGLWSKLPEEVLHSIFSRVSAYDIVRVGCTCTHLRAFISSRRPTPSPIVGLVAVVSLNIPALDLELLEMTAWVHDPSRCHAWFQLSLRFLLPNLPACPLYPVASAGGLLCLGNMRKFIVCNPITRSCQRLPDCPLQADMVNGQSFKLTYDMDSIEAYGMVYDSLAGSYDVFVLHHSVLPDKTESTMMQYSSALSQWRVLPPLVAGDACQLHNTIITPCISGLYTLMEKEGAIVVFAYRDGIWSEIKAPECTSSTLLKAFLMDFHGDLHMVGGMGSRICSNFWEVPTSICIWKLSVNGKDWMEMMRMPAPVLEEFRRLMSFKFWSCWGKDGVMYMKSFRSDVLKCELSSSEWKWLKGLELDISMWGLIFEPSLSASP